MKLVDQLILNEPLMILPRKLETILAVVADREQFDIELKAEEMEMAAPSTSLTGGGSVAVIPVTGSLTHRATGLNAMSGLATYESIDSMLDDALANDSVSEIVLDVNSPGGAVAGAFDLADRIYAARSQKPITAIVNEQACSAAYLIASAANEIYMPRTGNAGSIGVITAHVDRSKANEANGYKVTYITAGAKKAAGNPDEPLPEETKADIQARIDSAYDLFVESVARNRGLTDKVIRGQEADVFTGDAAKNNGLVDQIMSAKDALRLVLDRNKPQPARRSVQRRAKAIAINNS